VELPAAVVRDRMLMAEVCIGLVTLCVDDRCWSAVSPASI
jgi:hypothetical protein